MREMVSNANMQIRNRKSSQVLIRFYSLQNVPKLQCDPFRDDFVYEIVSGSGKRMRQKLAFGQRE